MTASTDKTHKEIATGKYRNDYLVYARRSTDEPESQKNSISFQKAETARYARREGHSIAALTLAGFCTEGVISERHSAFKEAAEMDFGDDGTVTYRVDRPKFHRLASYLAQGDFKGVIFLCWDRASRNKGDEVIIRKLMKQGVEFLFVQATYEDSSAGELHKDVDGMFSEHHSRVTREKVKDIMQRSRERGLCTHRARVGYLNPGTMEHKPFDPERAPLVKALFEKVDETDWSLSDLRRWLIAQGFTMPPMRRRRTREEMLEDEERDERRGSEKVCVLPSLSSINDVLRSPFYTGKVLGNDGEWVKSASHEPLISEELFARVQQKLARRRTSVHYDKKLPLPFRGFLRHACGRVYTPYEQKGTIYFGARCDRSCPVGRRSVNLGYVHQEVEKALDQLILTEAELAALDRATKADSPISRTRHVEYDAQARRIRKLREDLAYIADNRLALLRSGAYSPEALAAEEQRFRTELATLEEVPVISFAETREAIAEAIRLSELIKGLRLGYKNANPDLKETYARTVFSELELRGNTVNYKARGGFAVLKCDFFSESALSAWLSELSAAASDIRLAEHALTEVLGLGAHDMSLKSISP